MKRTLLLCALVLSLAGCSDPYGACVKAGADIATGISGGARTVVQLEASGLITQSEELNVLGYMKFANDADGAFLTCVSSANTAGSKAGTFTACAQAFNTSLANPTELALIHVSNPNAQTQITTISQTIATGVATLITALGGK